MKLNTSYKYNNIIGFTMGFWVFLFLFLTRPFNQHSLALLHLFKIALGMSIIIFLSYLLSVLIQNKIYKLTKTWSPSYEMFILFSFCLVLLMTSFIYYKSDFSQGGYSFFKYFYADFIPTMLIILPFLIFSRRYIVKYNIALDNQSVQKIVTISGENKLDFIKINSRDLISVSSSQNYCEIHFLRGDSLEKKLMRIPLKKILEQCPFLIRVHRSHLINPDKLTGFKDSKTLALTHVDIPFSKSYKKIIEKL
ncbi:MAG: LytTR family transcriptional regulator [Proteobacteria bacterium]|nr:LytTR family transcriptional regulator [Pseudomonadota bacterium]